MRNIAEFLVEDFAALDAGVIARCSGLSGKRLYLSGATGFFGKNLLSLFAYLRTRGVAFRVTALSRSSEAFLARETWCKNLDWLEWLDGDATREWPGAGPCDLVIHAAADTRGTFHRDKAAVFSHVLDGTQRALEFAERHGVQRLLLTGSGAQYGAIPASLADGIPETSALACDSTSALNAYGEAKRAAEMLAAIRAEIAGFTVVNTRCFAFVGPGLELNGHFAIGNFIRDALAGTPIRLASAGEALRSYLYGADLAVWLVLLLLECESGACINVGSDVPVRIVDLAGRVRDRLNPHLAISVGTSVQEERSVYVPAIGAARQRGLNVWTTLDRAIERTAAWYRAPAPRPPLARG